MGHRANFIVIRNGEPSAYYGQWAALSCLLWFAAGPDEAAAALTEMEQTRELMDWAFAEGGYLIDFDNNIAITFGYLDLPEDMEDEYSKEVDEVNSALQRGPREFLQQIASCWKTWLLQWDDRGVDAFSAYLHFRNISGIKCQPDSHPPNPVFAEYQA